MYRPQGKRGKKEQESREGNASKPRPMRQSVGPPGMSLRGGGGRGNSRVVLVHRGPGRFPWVQDMEKCPRRVNAVLPCRRVPNEAIDSNANAPAIDSKDRHRLDKSRCMQGERQTCAEKEVQSVSAIKLQSSATRRRKKTELQTRRRVILCDVASPWSRPCSQGLCVNVNTESGV